MCCLKWMRSKKLITHCVGRCEWGSFSDQIVSTPSPIRSKRGIMLCSKFQFLKSGYHLISARHAQYTWLVQREVFTAEDTNESFNCRTHDLASNASYCTATHTCMYFPMRRLLGYRLKEFGRDGMLLWVPVAEYSRSTELLLTYKCKTWRKWISRMKY